MVVLFLVILVMRVVVDGMVCYDVFVMGVGVIVFFMLIVWVLVLVMSIFVFWMV